MIALTALALAPTLGPCGPQEPEDDVLRPVDLRPRHVELVGEVARIPFTLGGRRPVPVVEAMVNGKGPFQFFYDTGASVCVFDSGFIEELGIPSLGKTEIGDHTASQRISADEVEIASLEFEGIRFEGVPAVAFDRRRMGGANVRGVLGLPLFHDHLLTVDYHEQRMDVSSGTLPEEGPGIVPFGGDVLPEMTITVDGEELACHIDSGAPSGLMLPTAFVEGKPHKGEPRKIGQARTVNSVLEIWRVQLDATAVIAGTEFVDPDVTYNDRVPRALIGYGILKDMVFTLDQRSRRLRLLPTSASQDLKAIERAALDYAESYYEVAPDYVERSIHPDLDKLGYVWKDGRWETHPMDYDGFMGMVKWHASNDRVPEPGPKDVVVLEATDRTALVQLTGSWGVDYLQLARFDGRWQTRHVVWQTAPGERSEEDLEADRAAVERAAREYLESVYDARPELLEERLHPDSVTLGFARGDEARGDGPWTMTRAQRIEWARTWRADGDEATVRPAGEVAVRGVMDRVACVEVTASWGVEYLSLIEDEDAGWRILHVMSRS